MTPPLAPARTLLRGGVIVWARHPQRELGHYASAHRNKPRTLTERERRQPARIGLLRPKVSHEASPEEVKTEPDPPLGKREGCRGILRPVGGLPGEPRLARGGRLKRKRPPTEAASNLHRHSNKKLRATASTSRRYPPLRSYDPACTHAFPLGQMDFEIAPRHCW